MCIDDQLAESGQVGVLEIVRGDRDIEGMALGLRPVMHGEVLGRGDDLEVPGVGTLQTGDKSCSYAAGEEGIFPIGLLPAAPARIAKNIDVRRPQREAVEDRSIALALRLVVFGSRFC